MRAGQCYLYVGSWGNREQKGRGEGISVFNFNSDNGNLIFEMLLPIDEPGILAATPNGRYLYAVNEMTNFPDGEFAVGGGITAMQIDPQNGHLRMLNQTPSLGSLPAHLSVDPNGEYVGCAIHGSFAITSRYTRQADGRFHCEKTYDSSGISLFRIQSDGSVAPGCDLDLYQTEGSYFKYKDHAELADHGFPGCRVAPAEIFQSRPHAHSINFHSSGLAIVCDRGSDMLYLYEIHRGTERYRKLFSYHARLGTAPRHLVFHPYLPYFYITNELESSVTAFALEVEQQRFYEIQSIRTLDQDSKYPNAPSDIHIHPSGKYVYASNRGDNSIAVYRITPSNGKLKLCQILHLPDASPRGFDISPNGRFLVVGNMDADSISVYRIDEETGYLSDTGCREKVNTPTCIRFVTV